jgi:hypothetical protein
VWRTRDVRIWSGLGSGLRVRVRGCAVRAVPPVPAFDLLPCLPLTVQGVLKAFLKLAARLNPLGAAFLKLAAALNPLQSA